MKKEENFLMMLKKQLQKFRIFLLFLTFILITSTNTHADVLKPKKNILPKEILTNQ